jgi:hypothetical protein
MIVEEKEDGFAFRGRATTVLQRKDEMVSSSERE